MASEEEKKRLAKRLLKKQDKTKRHSAVKKVEKMSHRKPTQWKD